VRCKPKIGWCGWLSHQSQLIVKELFLQKLLVIHLGERDNKAERHFWWPINKAWDALAYDHYERNSWSKHIAGLQLSGHYQRTRESIIKLSDPQVRIIDALAEAVGIPHKGGQAEMEIPEEAKFYQRKA
jgi:hypothetical protein